MPQHVFCYLGPNKQNEHNEKVVQTLVNDKMGDQNNSTSAPNFNSPAEPEEKTSGRFSVHFWTDRFFLVSVSSNSDHSHYANSQSRRD